MHASVIGIDRIELYYVTATTFKHRTPIKRETKGTQIMIGQIVCFIMKVIFKHTLPSLHTFVKI